MRFAQKSYLILSKRSASKDALSNCSRSWFTMPPAMTEILHRIEIAAPPARLFEAITTKRGFEGWWTDDVVAEPRLGSVAKFGFFGHGIVFDMRIDALTPPHRVHWTCLAGPEDWVGTEIEFRLTPEDDGGTRLDFTHGKWRRLDGHYPSSNTTWGHLMHRLKAYAEGKSPGPYFVGSGVAE